MSSKKIKGALLSASDAFTERIEVNYGAMAVPRTSTPEQFALRDFVIAADSLSEGLGLRDRLDDTARRVIVRPTGRMADRKSGPSSPWRWKVWSISSSSLIPTGPLESEGQLSH